MKKIFKNKLLFTAFALALMFLVGIVPVQAATVPNNGYHVMNIKKVGSDTIQVQGYFYNVGRTRFNNINNFKITVKDANRKIVSSTFNDANLKKVTVEPGKKVNWNFNIKIRNLKAYNFSKWSCSANYKYKY
jgi:hypothetical protein